MLQNESQKILKSFSKAAHTTYSFQNFPYIVRGSVPLSKLKQKLLSIVQHFFTIPPFKFSHSFQKIYEESLGLTRYNNIIGEIIPEK